ncbi:ABC transporter substrate-binding protein [Paenibacillus xerothermodurans]|uniref:Sugar ABC transporter substrate-binding protein n=1 Tax=Paenibacillus xerothermodurans TaxID=1977292 RepID=A0A2W1NEQ6_PAEXE|nr:sugar ABC transporter substrate-binding protein [Paenibacillus xerothermodurans]PZE22140.1 sugar ABC transporter substrate-binding protein [Paenibacillus xerothermodurans]
MKYLKLTSIVMAAALVATGCAAKEAAEGTSGAAAPDGKVKLTFWTNARHDADLMEQKIKQFNETNKSNIQVEYRIMTDNYEQALQVAIQSDEAPDIMNAKSKLNMQDVVKMKAIEPLDEYLTPEMKARFGEQLLNLDRINTVDGKLYTLPNYGSTFRLLYNKDLFAKAGLTEPPKSLDELVTYASKITEAGENEGVYGFAVNMKNPVAAFERALTPLVRLDGKDYYDWKTGKYDFTIVTPYVETFKKIVENKSMLPGYESLDIDPLRNQFAQGKIGMYMSLSAEPSVYDTQFPTKIDWGVAQVPTIDGQAPKGANYIHAAGNWLYMSATSKHKKEAWEFMQYMYSDDVLVPYFEQGKGVGIIPSVVEKAKEPTLKNFKDFSPKDDAIWPATLTHKVEGKAWQNVIAESILGVTPLDKAIADLNKRYNEGLDNAEKAGTVKRVVIPDFNPRNLVTQ